MHFDDWNEAFADIWRQEIQSGKKFKPEDGLKDGWIAKGLNLDLASQS